MGVTLRPVGIHNVPGGSCDNCHRPRPPDRLFHQDGMWKCEVCKKRHGRKEYMRLLERSFPDYGAVAYFGGRRSDEPGY